MLSFMGLAADFHYEKFHFEFLTQSGIKVVGLRITIFSRYCFERWKQNTHHTSSEERRWRSIHLPCLQRPWMQKSSGFFFSGRLVLSSFQIVHEIFIITKRKIYWLSWLESWKYTVRFVKSHDHSYQAQIGCCHSHRNPSYWGWCFLLHNVV